MTTLATDLDTGEVTITLVRGDSDDLLFTITDDADPPAPIDLSAATDGTAARPAVVRFAVKSDPDDQDNAEAIVFKASHDASQVVLLPQTGATLGQCKVLLDKPDTEEAPVDTEYRWDLEVTRQDILRTAAGTVSMVADSNVVTGTGTAFTGAKAGDVFQPLGPLNTKPAIITRVVSDTSMEVDRSDFQNESDVAMEVRRGKSTTVLRGTFDLLSGVVAD